jgi:ribonuclease HI
MMVQSGFEVFTDGSFEPFSRYGGWAFVVYRDSEEILCNHGTAPVPSNNAIEVRCCECG